MKKILSTILTTLILTSGMCVDARTLSADVLKILIADEIKSDLASYKPDEVIVGVSNLPVESITIPEGKVSLSVTSNSKGFNPKEFKKITIMVNKKPVKIIHAATTIQVFKNVPVAKEVIARDKAIGLRSVELKKVDITRNLDDVLTLEDLSAGLIARKMFYPSELITKKYTISRPDVVRNAIVSVNFKSGDNLSVIVEGIALSQGRVGDTIQVKNKNYNKIYTGVVVGENRVQVEI